MLRIPLRKLAAAVLVVLLCATFATPLHASPASGSCPSFAWLDWLQSFANDVSRAFDRAENPAHAEPNNEAAPSPPQQPSYQDADFSGNQTESLPTVDPDG
jgi:hypothetical protein